MNRTVRDVVAVSGLALLGASPAAAQEVAGAAPSPPRTSLEEEIEVLVTASRHEAAAFELPWSTGVVGSREIQDVRQRRTLPDAMSDLPGVMVQKTSYGQASPYVRGFTGYHTVLLVDGIRLNNSTFRSGPNQYWGTVDAFTVDRLEVVRGPSSVLYGSDAVGGAVNAIARRRTSFEPGVHGGGRTVLRLSEAENSWTWRAEAEGNQDRLGWIGGVTFKRFGDLEAGGATGHQAQTAYRDTDGDLRLDFREDDGSVWSIGFQHVDQDDVPRTHVTVDGLEWHGTSRGDELQRDLSQNRDLVYLRHRREIGSALADAIELTGSWQRQRETQHRRRDPVKTDFQGADVATLGLQAQAEKDSAYGFLTYGVEYWHDDVTSFRDDYESGRLVLRRIQGPVADDASYDLLGFYAQDEVTFGDTVLTGGARFTYAAADADRLDNPRVGGGDPATSGNVISLHDSWNAVVGSVRALHPVAASWNVFGGVSQGFRAPNLSDLTRLDDTSGVETPAPGLDPERFVSGEAGLKTQEECWSGQVALWATRIEDLIVPSPTGRRVRGTPEVRKGNVGDGWIAGVEAEATVRLDASWSLGAAGSWQDGEVDQRTPAGRRVRRPLSKMMPLTGVVTVTWREPGAGWGAWASGRAVHRQDQLSLKDATDDQRIPPGGTPGYFVASIGASFDLSQDARLSVAIENLGDLDYRVHGSGVNEPGRNLVVAVDLRF